MRLLETIEHDSPLGHGRFRLEAKIEIESHAKVLHYWFDFPAEVREGVATSADGWAVLMYPLACYFGEILKINLPLDRRLVENLQGIGQVWHRWYPEITASVFDAPNATWALPGTHMASKTIACFSGGIDSFFTLARNGDALVGDASSPIDELLCLAGFNTGMNTLDSLCARMRGLAERFGRPVVPVVTNARYGKHGIETPFSQGVWMEKLAHGAVLASAVHLLGRRYREFVIPATHSYSRLIPWGSHPLTDPLLTSSHLCVVHDGTSYTRVERTAFVVKIDTALDNLHVCWQDEGAGNCSHCEKCLRTMATLDLLGAKERARTFNWTKYSMHQLSRVWLSNPNSRLFFTEIVEAAEKAGRGDIAVAARASLNRSKRRQFVLGLMNSNALSRCAWQQLCRLRRPVLKASSLDDSLLGERPQSLTQ
jgi:hypothetical protein